MELIGTIVVYIIMACAIAGCLASVIKPESELGQQFVAGIDSIGPIFLPVAGIMAAAPYLTAFVSVVFGPAYSAVGADPAMAATTFIAVDMGGYQLADALAETRESWIMAMVTGYMAGATIVFSIPVALKMLEKRDRKYLALGVMSGLLAIPIGVLVASAIITVSHPMVREVVSTNADATYQLALSWGQIGVNLIPLIIICVALAAGLKFKPDAMIKGFIVFGRVMESALKIVFVLVVVEYFTGVWSTLFGSFGFDPIIADEEDIFRALEVSGAIGMMLCGAFPMVYLHQALPGKAARQDRRRGGAVLRRDGGLARGFGQRARALLDGEGPACEGQGHLHGVCRVLRIFVRRSLVVYGELPAEPDRGGACGQVGRRYMRDRVREPARREEGRAARARSGRGRALRRGACGWER